MNKINKSVAVWLILKDGKNAGKVLLQQRAKIEIIRGKRKPQFAPFVCQSTWNEKVEREESLIEAVKRGAKEELGEQFARDFDFKSLKMFNKSNYTFKKRKMTSYDFVGVVSQRQLKKVKLHPGAMPKFILAGREDKENLKIFGEKNAAPPKQIVLFKNQLETLKVLLS